MNNLGVVASKRDFELGYKYLRKAFQVRKDKSVVQNAVISANISSLFIKIGHYDQAESYAKHSAKLIEPIVS